MQIDEVGEDVARSRRQQTRGDIAVDCTGDIPSPCGPVRQGCEHFGLALGAVGDEPVETCGGVSHRRSVSGQVEPVGAVSQPSAGGEKIRHVAVRR